MDSIDISSLKIPGVISTEFLVTRDEGAFIRDHITNRLMLIPENKCLYLDFSGVKFIDLSGADEIIAILVARIKSKEFGKRYICLVNITTQHRVNIERALKDKKLSVMLYQNGTFEPFGDINPYLQQTFDFVASKKRITARELADEFKIPINTASTRLLNLYNEGLVIRIDDVTDKGTKQFVYSLFEF